MGRMKANKEVILTGSDESRWEDERKESTKGDNQVSLLWMDGDAIL